MKVCVIESVRNNYHRHVQVFECEAKEQRYDDWYKYHRKCNHKLFDKKENRQLNPWETKRYNEQRTNLDNDVSNIPN